MADTFAIITTILGGALASLLGWSVVARCYWRYHSILPGTSSSYTPDFLSATEVLDATNELSTLDWTKRRVAGPSGSYKLSRGTCAFGDVTILERKVPAIWGSNMMIQPWPPTLAKIKARVEEQTGRVYNVALVNRYETGRDSIYWHSDKEELGDQNSIASISLGAERTFQFRVRSSLSKGHLWDLKWITGQFCLRKRQLIWSRKLRSGSLFFMGKDCQEWYEHRIPEERLVNGVRFNITFRRFHYPEGIP